MTTREEKNNQWIEALKEKGISKIELDLVNNKVKLKIHNLNLYSKFTDQINEINNSFSKLSYHSFDTRLNINLIGLLITDISELEIPSDIIGFAHPFRTIKFEDNTATVEMHAGIIDVEITPIEGKTLDNDDTYWIKSP